MSAPHMIPCMEVPYKSWHVRRLNLTQTQYLSLHSFLNIEMGMGFGQTSTKTTTDKTTSECCRLHQTERHDASDPNRCRLLRQRRNDQPGSCKFQLWGPRPAAASIYQWNFASRCSPPCTVCPPNDKNAIKWESNRADHRLARWFCGVVVGKIGNHWEMHRVIVACCQIGNKMFLQGKHQRGWVNCIL